MRATLLDLLASLFDAIAGGGGCCVPGPLALRQIKRVAGDTSYRGPERKLPHHAHTGRNCLGDLALGASATLAADLTAGEDEFLQVTTASLAVTSMFLTLSGLVMQFVLRKL